MRRKSLSSKITQSTNELLSLMQATLSANSRFEDRFWQSRAQALIHTLLAGKRDEVIETVLTELSTSDPDLAHDLLEHVHAASQSVDMERDGQRWQVLLMSSAFAVWTRYQLPQVALSKEDADYFVAGLKQTVFAPDVIVQALPKLLGLDEMPRSYSEIYHWLMSLSQHAFDPSVILPRTISIEPNPSLLVDTRHFVVTVAVPEGKPLFRWQLEESVSQSQCEQEWLTYITPRMNQLMAGCQFHALVAQAFHASIEMSEQHIRAVSITSAVQWLEATLNLESGILRASIAAVGEDTTQEYRVGYYRPGQPDVIYGTIWPVLEDADMPATETMTDTFDDITAILKSAGISHVTRIPGILWPESCDDCTAPLFPNTSGELVHIDLPEEAFDAPQHFH